MIGEGSRLVQFDSASGEEGPEGSWSFTRGKAPVTSAVSSVARSVDGRWLAVADRSGDLVTLDLLSGERTRVADAGDVVDVTAGGALTSTGRDLRVVSGTSLEEVALDRGDNPSAATRGGRLLAVPAADRRSTTVRSLDGGTRRPSPGRPGSPATAPGWSRCAPLATTAPRSGSARRRARTASRDFPRR